MIEEMPEDPYPMDQTLAEVRAQMNRFIALTGHRPGYIHPHSLMTPNTEAAIRAVGAEFEVPYSMDFYKAHGFHSVTNTWNPKPFPFQTQLDTDVEREVLQVIPEVLEFENNVLVCHAGFVDADIFEHSTYTFIRARDLQMACSWRLHRWLEEHKIELITYQDFA